MYFNDIAINFAIILSSDIEFLVNLYVLEFFMGVFFYDEDDVSEGVKEDVNIFLLVNHKGKEFIKILAILLH
jgi:hypothetical protein